MFHYIILDDDTLHNSNMKKRLELIFKQQGIGAIVALASTDPNEVINYSTLNNKRSNVYLLDVNVQRKITGIDVAGVIRNQDASAYIVFISAHPEFVLQSLKTRVFDYLIKPVALDTLEGCVKMIHQDYAKLNNPSEQVLGLKSGFNVYHIAHDEIVFFEKFGHLLVVHTSSGKIESSESLESIEQKLNNHQFFRCHKSYIVNLTYISKIDSSSNTVYLKNGEECPVSKRSKKELKDLCNF